MNNFHGFPTQASVDVVGIAFLLIETEIKMFISITVCTCISGFFNFFSNICFSKSGLSRFTQVFTQSGSDFIPVYYFFLQLCYLR